MRGERVVLRPVTIEDAGVLAEVLSEPAVEPWWPGPWTTERVRREVIDDDEVVVFAVEVDGRVVGLVQYWQEDDPEYRHAGMDIALHPDVHGLGIGTETLTLLSRHLFDELGHHRVVIDPAVANERAIACYRKVGFKAVGVMRQYERGGDGTWRDSLLMDMLREELAGG